MDLSNKNFELVENSDGHASSKTIMKFSDHAEPFTGTYTGPNTIYGQVIVRISKAGDLEMLYQSLTTEGELVAGRAQVSLNENENHKIAMQLKWQWLTGDLSNGVSVWHEIGNLY